MQLHLPTHSETRGLYTRTEYDDIRLGPPRVVYSYCPRTHRYVRDVAHAILAAQGVPADDPDAVIAEERLPHESLRHVSQAKFFERRRAEYEAKMLDMIQDAGGKPVLAIDVADALGVSRSTVDRLCEQSDVLKTLRRKNLGGYVGLTHHTKRDLPLSANEQRMVDVMTELGEAIWQVIADRMGWKSKNRITRYKHMFEWRTERVTNGHMVYDRRIYRLKPEYANGTQHAGGAE